MANVAFKEGDWVLYALDTEALGEVTSYGKVEGRNIIRGSTEEFFSAQISAVKVLAQISEADVEACEKFLGKRVKIAGKYTGKVWDLNWAEDELRFQVVYDSEFYEGDMQASVSASYKADQLSLLNT